MKKEVIMDKEQFRRWVRGNMLDAIDAQLERVSESLGNKMTATHHKIINQEYNKVALLLGNCTAMKSHKL